jgi:hypothetical protein
MHEIVLKENLWRLKEEKGKGGVFYQRLWFEDEMETFKVAWERLGKVGEFSVRTGECLSREKEG